MFMNFKGAISITKQLGSIIQNTFPLPDRVISDITNGDGGGGGYIIWDI